MNSENDQYELKRYKHIVSGTIYRAYSRRGLYFREGFKSSNASFHVDEKLILSACHFNENNHGGAQYSEFDEVKIEEIKLLSSIFLSIDHGNFGIVCYYPFWFSYRDNEINDLLLFCPEDKIIDKISNMDGLSQSENIKSDSCINRNYTFKNVDTPLKTQSVIYQKIDENNYLLIRGLSSLLKASMLARHRMFLSEAMLCLYVSLDASYSLIKRILEKKGLQKPKSQDAQYFIEQIFGENFTGRKYFEDFYVDRIIAVHPQNKYGIFPYLPNDVDDYYFLLYGLQTVYTRLIIEDLIC